MEKKVEKYPTSGICRDMTSSIVGPTASPSPACCTCVLVTSPQVGETPYGFRVIPLIDG